MSDNRIFPYDPETREYSIQYRVDKEILTVKIREDEQGNLENIKFPYEDLNKITQDAYNGICRDALEQISHLPISLNE